jgi:tetratricopeptide (TPR) repeat protein
MSGGRPKPRGGYQGHPSTRTPTITAASTPLLRRTIDDFTLDAELPSTVVARLPVGSVVNGRYEIESVLGAGGMGIVYRVRDRQNPERLVALKTVRASWMSANTLSLFKAEFKTMSGLRHPNVGSVYDFELIAGSDEYLFTMELVEGKTILDVTNETDQTRIVELVVQICRALSYMHSRGVIHFDLKPANILVDRFGRVRVLDFGVAGAPSKRDASSAAPVGSPVYMAPELTTGAGIDHRVDFYSLGVTLFELLCRRVPFEASSPISLVLKHAREPIAFTAEERERIPAWLRALVERLCAKDPSARYRSGSAIIEAINADGGLSFAIDTSETRESYFFSGKFVGREPEQRRLTDFVRRRLSGDGATGPPMCAVSGPAGVGKSRLMLELRRWAQLSRFTFIEANCYEGSLSEYGPIADAIGYVIRLADAASAGDLVDRFAPELARLYPELAHERNVVAAQAGVSPQDDRVGLIDRVCEFLLAVAERAPFVLYVNDVHWARSGTIDLVSYILRSITVRERNGDPVRLAVVVTYRDDETENRPVEKSLEQWAARSEFEHVALAPLADDDLAELVASMLGIESLPEAFIGRIAHETAGNPFFVGEVIRSLVENDAIYLQHGHWAADRPIDALEIPSSMRQALEHRLKNLNGPERAVLQVLAVHGRPITTSMLAAVSGVAQAPLHAVLRTLCDRHLAAPFPDAEATYRTSHDRLREMISASLSGAERRALHRRIAETIETVYAGAIDQHIEALAEHYSLADVPDKALHYCLLGGRRAKHVHAIEVGSRLFAKTLELLPLSETEQRLRVSEDLADMQGLSGAFDAALARYDGILVALDGDFDKARILRKKSIVQYARAAVAKAVDLAWQSLSLLGDEKPRSRAAITIATARQAAVHLYRRTFPSRVRVENNPARRALIAEQADTYLALIEMEFAIEPALMPYCWLRALNLAQALGPSRQLSAAYSLIGLGYAWLLGDFKRADYYTGVGEKMGRALGSPWHVAHAVGRRSMVRMLEGDWARGVEEARIARNAFQIHGDMHLLGVQHCLLVIMHHAGGDLDAARREAERGLEALERVGAFMNSNPICIKCAAVSAELGDDGSAARQIDRACELAQRFESEDLLQVIWVEVLRGHVHFASGRIREAVAAFETSQRMRRERAVPVDFVTGRVNPMLVRAYVELLGETSNSRDRAELLRKAKAVASEGLRFTKRFRHIRASALVAAAVYEWEAGHESGARRLFEQGMELARKQQAKIVLADAHFELGRRLKRSMRERQSAREHLRKAFHLYTECDAAPYVARARAALEGA